ncbi:interferon-induced GTP-binding Mx2 [Fusarium mundagurra]|uniref:Interferon-induced GTP-binding Mx2 n=1 Tax=Fusarium mundagurra TaxID=1567541 RepID=A0A8H6D0F6_9HYPO|nr:interferon-induced GTP-binding Mx2 [Fusarium mundagurra]
MMPIQSSLVALAILTTSCIAISKNFYPSSKRGLIYIPNSDFPSDDNVWVQKHSDLTWYYNYKPHPSPVYENNTSLQFVPMLWGAPDGFDDTSFLENVTAQIIGGRNITYVMGFNEPDNSMANGGSDMKPKDAAKYWIKQLEPLRKLGVSLGAPGVTGAPSGFTWLADFVEACKGNCTFDFIPIHWYGSFDGMASHIAGVLDVFPGKKIWVTEFALDFSSLAATQDYFQTSVKYLDGNKNVTHYSYFGSFRSFTSNVGYNVSMLNSFGQLTDIGSWYLGGDATGVIPGDNVVKPNVTAAKPSTPTLALLAIIGDKGSGKTSLFEALSGLSLHGSHISSTKFPIHVCFTHSSRTGTTLKARIKPGKVDGDNEDLSDHLQSFEVNYEGDLAAVNIPQIVNQATNHMQIATAFSDEKEQEEQQVSDNVLVIEISGPDFFSMEIVDTPGLSSSPAVDDTQELTRSLIMDLVKQPNTIILSVVDATSDMTSQEGPRLARAADVTGNRIVAVVTKCDLVPPEERRFVLRAMRNKERHLGHPWFAIRSLSSDDRDNDCTLETRNSTEDSFFSEMEWAVLKRRRRVGAPALKDHLKTRVNVMLRGSIDLLTTILNTPSHSIAPTRNPSITEKVQHTNVYATSQETVVADVDLEFASDAPRPTPLLNAVIVGLTVAICLCLIALGCSTMALEIASEGHWYRLFLLVTAPPQIILSLFFCQAIVVTIFQMVGPVTQLKVNSKFYSAKRTKRLDGTKVLLPHVTIQCPVYKEGLEGVIRPTVQSLSAAIRNYESFGGTASIFINDDGMQLVSPEEAEERRMFYKENNIGWVARPGHNTNGEGIKRFIRRGKFKKASNMNYALGISLKVEDKLVQIVRDEKWSQVDEDAAYQKCLDEVLSEELGRAWVGGDIRVGDYLLLVDSDTRVPTDCLIDAVSELEASPRVAILQFTSGVMNVTTSYFESGITFFTNLIYTAITYAVANGDVSPFVGHNAFIRWSALQEVGSQDNGIINGEKDPNATTPYEKFWSESHVSEDFDISLRLQTLGYHIRLAAYCGDGFKEGVSLTVYDELARWEKYAYGCSELLFWSVKDWWRHGIFTPLFKRFIMSNMPLGSKITIMSYIGTYYAIGYSWIGSLLNYFLIGWLNGELDHYYMSSWRVWVALVVVFSIAGNITLALIRYRSQQVSLLKELWTCFKWVALMFVFLGGISMHVCKAILCHMLSIDISWGATSKEVEDTNFFQEISIIIAGFKYVFIFCLAVTALMICGVYAFPYLWRIDELVAIFPLATVIFCHFFLPIALNPNLMKFTW